MENLTLRFPHLSENIFNLLDNENIARCMQVSRFWKGYLNNPKFLDFRKITAIVEQFHKVEKPWKMVFETGSTSTIRELRIIVGHFYQKGTNNVYHDGLTPQHVAAGTGQLQLLKALSKETFEE